MTRIYNARLFASSSTAIFFLSLLAGPSFGAEETRVIINEDFESFANSESLRAVWPGGTAQLELNVPGGGTAAFHDGSTMNKRMGFEVQPDDSHVVVLTADFYDFATNTDKRVTVSLNSGSDNLSIGLNSMSSYVVRAVGFSASTNWYPFKRNIRPVEGWHRFQATLSTSNLIATLDLNADGKIDRYMNVPLTRRPPKFNQIRFGGLTGRPSKGGPILVDNIRIEVRPVEQMAMITAALSENAMASPIESLAPAVTPPGATNAGAAPLQSPPLSSNGGTGSGLPAAVSAAAANWSPTTLFWWILGALAVVIGLLVGVLLLVRRQTASNALALLALPSTDGSSNRELPAGGGDWRDRALQAEAIAAKQAQFLRDKVGPDLVEFAKQALVQGLYSQRSALLETQRKAQAALAELELRLSDLELPQDQRIRTYETRIAELEKQLETRDEEMRELTKATLLLVRQKLEEERESARRFN